MVTLLVPAATIQYHDNTNACNYVFQCIFGFSLVLVAQAMKILVFSARIKSSAKGYDETSCEPALMQKGTATR